MVLKLFMMQNLLNGAVNIHIFYITTNFKSDISHDISNSFELIYWIFQYSFIIFNMSLYDELWEEAGMFFLI